MELTINEALQQGVVAHKKGRLQEAEKLYRAILDAQPNHPDANHNLGVLAVGFGKFQEALPYLKFALEANPKQGQFWLSYADALIKLGQLDTARKILQRAISVGLKDERLDQLNVWIGKTHLSNSVLKSSIRPSQDKIERIFLLEFYIFDAIFLANNIQRIPILMN